MTSAELFEVGGVGALEQEGFVHVGSTADIPYLEGRTTAVGEDRVAVFNTESGFYAIAAHCPHKAGPLADGIVSERCVTCPLHGWRIDVRTGEVVSGGTGSVRAYEVAEAGGELFVRAAPAE